MVTALLSTNVEDYIRSTYGKITKINTKILRNIFPNLQNDYEGDMDCTLVSILTVCDYFMGNMLDKLRCYNSIKAIAKKYLYKDNFGT